MKYILLYKYNSMPFTTVKNMLIICRIIVVLTLCCNSFKKGIEAIETLEMARARGNLQIKTQNLKWKV